MNTCTFDSTHSILSKSCVPDLSTQCESGFKTTVVVDGRSKDVCCKCMPGKVCLLCDDLKNCTTSESTANVAPIECFEDVPYTMLNPDFTDDVYSIECAADSKSITIAPQTCYEVSSDVCRSGFVTDKEDVILPGGVKSIMKQCCKCKPGHMCKYCKNPLDCTTEEKKQYVSVDKCFSLDEPVVLPNVTQYEDEIEDEVEVETNKYKTILGFPETIFYVILAALPVIGILIWFLIRPGSPQ